MIHLYVCFEKFCENFFSHLFLVDIEILGESGLVTVQAGYLLQVHLHETFAEHHKVLVRWDGHPIGEVKVPDEDVSLPGHGIESHEPSVGPSLQKVPDVLFESVLVGCVRKVYGPIFCHVDTVRKFKLYTLSLVR